MISNQLIHKNKENVRKNLLECGNNESLLMDRREQRSNSLDYIEGDAVNMSQSTSENPRVAVGAISRHNRRERGWGGSEGYLNITEHKRMTTKG